MSGGNFGLALALTTILWWGAHRESAAQHGPEPEASAGAHDHGHASHGPPDLHDNTPRERPAPPAGYQPPVPITGSQLQLWTVHRFDVEQCADDRIGWRVANERLAACEAAALAAVAPGEGCAIAHSRTPLLLRRR